jgi:hypothetical protein
LTIEGPREMTRLDELPKGESVTLLVYGPAGSGKTNLVGTAGSRTLIINTGLGLVTLQSPGFRKRYPNVNPIIETIIDEINPKNPAGYDKVCDLLDSYLNPSHPEFNNIDTIALDDATTLRRFALDKGIKDNSDSKLSETYAKRQAGKAVTTVQDYGAEMSLVDQFLIYYISLCKQYNKHFILTAHERIQYNKASAIGAPPTVNSIRPGFTGQTFPDAVTGHFDLVWYLETLGAGERIAYKARTAGDSALVAKTRWDGLFPVLIPNPNFLEVVKKIRES